MYVGTRPGPVGVIHELCISGVPGHKAHAVTRSLIASEPSGETMLVAGVPLPNNAADHNRVWRYDAARTELGVIFEGTLLAAEIDTVDNITASRTGEVFVAIRIRGLTPPRLSCRGCWGVGGA